MKRRLREIVKTILNSEDYVSGKFISETVEISLRTLRTDIKEINKLLIPFNVQVLAEHKKGYYLTIEDKQRIVDEQIIQKFMDTEFIHEIPSTPYDRMIYLLLKASVLDILDIDDLAEQLCVSSSTILKDVEAARRWVYQKLKLSLTCSLTKGIELIANEKEKRILLSRILTIKANSSTISKYSQYLDYDLQFLVDESYIQLVNDTCCAYELKMSGFSTTLMIIEISLASIRAFEGNPINGYESNQALDSVIESLKEAYERLSHHFLDHCEWLYLQDCFYAKQFIVPSNPKRLSNEEAEIIITAFIEHIPEFKTISESEKNYIANELRYTIPSMINRLRNNFCISNEISERYVVSLNESLLKAEIIRDILVSHLQLTPTLTELKYLAIQCETLLKPYKKLKNVILVSDYDYAIINLIVIQFNQVFNDYGHIQNIMTFNELQNSSDLENIAIDFYITTSNIASLTLKPFAHINPIMDIHDFNEIRKLIA